MAKNKDMGNMSSKLYLRAMALFMIALVITLPITFAASISGLQFDGTIGAGPVVKRGDTVTVLVNITEDEGESLVVGTLHQLLKLGSDKLFSGCVGTISAGKYTCTTTFSVPSSITSGRYGGIDVTLYDDAAWSNRIGKVSDYVYIDSERPIVNVNSVSQVGNKVEVVFGATDTALAGGLSTVCSGFGTVELYWLSGESSTPITFTMQPTTGCTYTNTTQVPITGLSDGVRQLCARITDRAGNSNQNCRSIAIDTSVPAIDGIEIVTGSVSNFNSLQYVLPTYGTGVFVQFNTTNSDPSKYVVTVNGESVGQTSCSGRTCRTGPYLLKAAGALTVSITGTSALGVVGTPVTKQITIGLDDVAPVFTSITTNKTLGGKSYYSPGMTLTARFTEAQSGLANKNVVLRIAGTTIGAPTNCSKSANNWDCIWGTVNHPAVGQGNLSVALIATDALGNVGTQGNATFFYDTIAPVVDLSTFNMSFIGTSDLVSVASSRSIFKFSFNVTDETSPITASVNMSAFDPRVNISTATCSTKNCSMTITTSQVGVGPFEDVAVISVSDALGNNFNFTTPKIEVLNTSTETNTSYFRHTLKLTPSALELTTFPYLNQKGYAVIDVRGVGKAKVLKVDFKPTSCRNIPLITVSPNGTRVTTPVTSASVGDVRLLKSNPQVTVANNSQILVAFEFKAIEVNQSNIQFLCDFDVAGRIGNTFIPREKETVLINFSTYNLSVGELGANYDKKLQDQIKKAQGGIGSKLAMLEKLFKVISQLCNLWRAIKVVMNMISLSSGQVHAVATPGMAFFVTIPFLAPIQVSATTFCVVSQGTDMAFESLIGNAFIAGLCKLSTCENKGLLDILSGDSVKNIVSSDSSASKTVLNSGKSGAVLQAAASTDTLAGSIIGLCIPGIIRALQRSQQIECQYAVCLRDEVPKGVPITACDSSYEYSSCMYKTANFFILGAIWDKIINMVKSLVADPIAIIGTIGAGFCVAACLSGVADAGISTTICATTKLVSAVGSIAGMLAGMKSDWLDGNQANQDYCKMLEQE